GPGIMQAANRGAFEGESKSIGLNISLPKEQTPNPYLDECLLFEHFFTRKVMLIKYADACVFFPGGFGTADELMEILTLVQTRKGRQIKILLFGEEFWTPLLAWFKTLENNSYINSTDLISFEIVDSIDKILEKIEA
ncbi:MAG: TIGR00730 family Rossman fold protein, partial [Candidatus Ruthia sp.]|nr:TIGR00730 family Rossman fold protein [Candidatus Ruthturnera sp.]